MTHFTIKDLAELSGLKQHTIRAWEHRYLFLNPQRSSNSRRIYSAEELNVLLDTVLLTHNGYKISRIDKLGIDEKVRLISSMYEQHQKVINDLIINMARMDGEAFSTAIDSAFLSWGMQETMQQIVMPFCEKIGLLEKGYTRRFQENILVIREIIKQKLYAAIESIVPPREHKSRALLFLPVGESNDLPILFLKYLLEFSGHKIIYLGQHVPVDHLTVILEQARPRYIITYLTKKNASAELAGFVRSLRQFNNIMTFIAIEQDCLPGDEVNDHYRHLSNIAAVVELMNAHAV